MFTVQQCNFRSNSFIIDNVLKHIGLLRLSPKKFRVQSNKLFCFLYLAASIHFSLKTSLKLLLCCRPTLQYSYGSERVWVLLRVWWSCKCRVLLFFFSLKNASMVDWLLWHNAKKKNQPAGFWWIPYNIWQLSVYIYFSHFLSLHILWQLSILSI